MSIRQDGEVLLSTLAREFGDTSFGTSAVHGSLFSAWDVIRLNNAIKWLRGKGYIKQADPIRGFGSPYEMDVLTVTTAGFDAARFIEPTVEPPVAHEPDEAHVMTTAPDKKKVFVIHGRNLAARKEMGYFLAAVGLEAINFDDLRASLGGAPTVADIVTAGMDRAQAVIALFTADEHAWTRPEFRAGESGEPVERWQSRPNVLFEAGMAFGRDRKRVVLVKLGRVSLFTDVEGIHALRPTNDPKGHRDTLRKTLSAMGCEVDLVATKWLHDGDFESPVAGLSEVSPPDPFRREH